MKIGQGLPYRTLWTKRVIIHIGSSTEITDLKILLLKICLHICSFSDLDPFLSAIWRGDAKALQDIIHLKSKTLDEPNKDGWLPLHESAYYGNVECLKILLKGDELIIFIMSRITFSKIMVVFHCSHSQTRYNKQTNKQKSDTAHAGRESQTRFLCQAPLRGRSWS